jgi:hypothetical protein
VSPARDVPDPELAAADRISATLSTLPAELRPKAYARIREHLARGLGRDTIRIAHVLTRMRESGAVLRPGERTAVLVAWYEIRDATRKALVHGRSLLATAARIVPTDDPEAAAELRNLYRIAKKC